MPFYLQKLLAHGGYLNKATDGTEGGSGGAVEDQQGDETVDGQQDQQTQQDQQDQQPNVPAEILAELEALRKEKADLLKETMKRKDALKAYGDLTPERAKELLAAEQERQQREQEEQTRRLEEQGQWDALKAQMIEQHNTEVQGLREQLDAASEATNALKAQIVELTVGQSFGNSSYLREKTVLPVSKARVLYGSHFEVNEQGQVVGYNKPAGYSDRAPLVDGKGEPVGFEEAISRIIAADPDADHILRSGQKQGAGSMSEHSIKPNQQSEAKTTQQKLAAGLNKLIK